MKFTFPSSRVLVTGASGGIGAACARLFADAGARVIAHYNHNQQKAEELVSKLPGDGHRTFMLDLSSPNQIAEPMGRLISEIGTIDILVNNAAVFIDHDITQLEFDRWHDVWETSMRVNLLGPACVTHTLIPHMISAGGGKIINITSRGAFKGEPTAPAYGASKAGLNAFSQSMAKLLAPDNVHVYAIAPGFTDTERVAPKLKTQQNLIDEIPLGRVTAPDEIARTVLFLASPGQESLTGCIIDANGASYLRS